MMKKMNGSCTRNFVITKELNIKVIETGVILQKEVKTKSGVEHHQSMPLSFNDWFSFCTNLKHILNWVQDGLKVINGDWPNGKCPAENQHLILSDASAIFLDVDKGKGTRKERYFLNISGSGWYQSFKDNKVCPMKNPFIDFRLNELPMLKKWMSYICDYLYHESSHHGHLPPEIK